MALLDFQTAMGRLVRAPDGTDPLRSLQLDEGERVRVDALKASAGYRFTVGVQRSWCVGRAARAGSLTLSILPGELRRRLLDEWTEAGGGTSSFFAAEAEGLLEFIASRLPDPSHELTLCRFEQATIRADEQANGFKPPDADLLQRKDRRSVRRGQYAGMAVFYGEPRAIIEALVKHQAPPPISTDTTALLFGPGVEQLSRVASSREIALWNALVRPIPFISLAQKGFGQHDVSPLMRAGIVELESSGFLLSTI